VPAAEGAARRVARPVLRAATAAAALAGVALLLARPGSGTGVLVYFTVQTNLALAAVMAWSVLRPGPSAEPGGAALRGAVTVFILITGLVYHLILTAPGGEFSMTAPPGERVDPWSGHLLHTATPVLALLEWCLGGPAQRALRWRWALLWLGYPACYLVFALVRGAVVGAYPYPFLDVSELGYPGVTEVAAVLAAAFGVLGLCVVALGRIASRRSPALLPGGS
jgi:hypothetical protein